jgi:ribonucleoside-diphosphate reductase alpha chain
MLVATATQLGLNARQVSSKRYSTKNTQGQPLEDWDAIVNRVVTHVSAAEVDPNEREAFYGDMAAIMRDRKFLPNTPCLVNAGRPDGQLAACYVLGVPDSIPGIMDHAKATARIHQTGGGTGMTYEHLRPAGALVNTTHGEASGPVSFMRIVNEVTDVVKQGGVRRGANMGMMRVTHPDILRFIHAKNDQTSLVNFNISVNVTDDFLEAVDNNRWFQLSFKGQPSTQPIFDPVTQEDYAIYVLRDEYPIAHDFKPPKPITFCDRDAFLKAQLFKYTKVEPPQPGMVYAPDIWNRIVASAHKYAEPGIAFIDEVNRHNHMMVSMGEIFSCNPCGEQFLHTNNSCNLGSIDVSKFYDSEYENLETESHEFVPPPFDAPDDLCRAVIKSEGREGEAPYRTCYAQQIAETHRKKSVATQRNINWPHLRHVTHRSLQFLDNVIDTCAWPLPEIEDTVKRTRPVGLGIMGFADLCLKLQITYGSPESCELMDELMGFIRREAWIRSLELGAAKGAFPEFDPNREAYSRFIYDEIGIPSTTPLTPRNYETTTCAPTGTISLVAETSSGIEPNFSWAYVRSDTVSTRTYVHTLAAKALGVDVDQTDQASIEAAAAYVVEHQHELPSYFVSAMEVPAAQHVQVLAATTRKVDNSVSKTCNGAATDTVSDVAQLYQLARQLGCKAVSYYRDGSRKGQVLTTMKAEPALEITVQPSIELPIQIEAPPEPPIAEAERAPDREDRPKELQGSSWQIKFESGNLYVTVNRDERHIMEVFVTGPISSSVGMLASQMLRGGFHAMELARTLDKCTGTHAVWFNQRLLTSPEQAVAECILIMQRRLTQQPDSAKESAVATNNAQPAGSFVTTKKCPDCGGPTEHLSGCDRCICGWARC